MENETKMHLNGFKSRTFLLGRIKNLSKSFLLLTESVGAIFTAFKLRFLMGNHHPYSVVQQKTTFVNLKQSISEMFRLLNGSKALRILEICDR